MKSYHHRDHGIGITFDNIVLRGGARTPFGALGGGLARVSPTDLGIVASRAALERTHTAPSDIDQAVVANIGQASYDCYFVARHISLYSGLPQTVPALQVQRICASGLETIITAAEQISLHKADAILACGTENMSLAPTVAYGNRLGYPLGQVVFKDALWEALDDTAAGTTMGGTAENVALEYRISRDEVDSFAMCSQERAQEAVSGGFFLQEIAPVTSATFEADGLRPRSIRVGKKGSAVAEDEHPRRTTLDALNSLPPAFKQEGVQTAGNSAGIVDGACSVVISTAASAHQTGREPIARIIAAASCGVDPKFMGIGPVPAVRLLFHLTGLTAKDIDLFEINEAFAAQVIACERLLELDHSKVNIHGGAIAIGHPLAASGTRLTLTLARSLKERGLRYGIATACIGGGQGTAILIESL